MSQDEGCFNVPSPFLQSCWLLFFVWQQKLLVQQSCKDQASLSEPSSSPSASWGWAKSFLPWEWRDKYCC